MIAVLLAVVLACCTPVSPDTFQPHFLSAQAGYEACWTGWQGRIQNRPQITNQYGMGPAIWIGGYTTNGAFIQTGIIANPYSETAFVWRIAPGPEDPLDQWVLSEPWGTWHLFSATLGNAGWTITMDGRVLAVYDTHECFAVFQAVSETWETGVPANPGIAAFQWLRVRDQQGRWIVPPDFTFSAPECNGDAVSKSRGNLVIRPSTGRCVGWKRLWS